MTTTDSDMDLNMMPLENTTAASIAGSQVVQYIYESGNGNLSRTVYANGNEIRYTYDSQDRMTESYFREIFRRNRAEAEYLYL